MITCDSCHEDFIPEPEVTFIGSVQALKGEPENECSPHQHLVCLCEKCYLTGLEGEVLAKVTGMNEEKQIIAIAEACGWRAIQDSEYKPFGKPYKVGYNPNGEANLQQLPNYLNDLNAMHEAEKLLHDDDIRCEFVDHLTFTVDGMWADAKRRFECATATAAQRAEAFLKTLKLWEHTK